MSPWRMRRGWWRSGCSKYESCKASGLDALLDDRDERPGVKFKDADLIGVGSGMVERKTRQATDVPVADAARLVAERLQ
jgi:prolyl-tRNA synthetase